MKTFEQELDEWGGLDSLLEGALGASTAPEDYPRESDLNVTWLTREELEALAIDAAERGREAGIDPEMAIVETLAAEIDRAAFWRTGR